MAAPATDRVDDSARNWNRISLRLAPRAFRTPISRIRPATDSNMIFMITMPPTTRETDTSPGIAANRILLMVSHVLRRSLDVWSQKLFSSPGRSRRSRLKAASTSSIAACISSVVRAFTVISPMRLRCQAMVSRNVEMGTSTDASRITPRRPPCLSHTPMTSSRVDPRRMRLPIGLTCGNSFSAMSAPMTATLSDFRSSRGDIPRPSAMSQPCMVS